MKLHKLCFAVFVPLVGSYAAAGQEVVLRARMGNHQEDVTFVPSGLLASHLVYIDGYEEYGLPAGGLDQSTVKKLFDVRRLPIWWVPRGIAWVESAQAFYFDGPWQPSTLILSDFKGNPLGTRKIMLHHYEGGTRNEEFMACTNCCRRLAGVVASFCHSCTG